MVVTATVKSEEEEHEIIFSVSNNATNKEILDRAFELGMNKYGYFDSVEISDKEDE